MIGVTSGRVRMFDILFAMAERPERIADCKQMLKISGRLIGRSVDDVRTFYVLDGKVWCIWPDVSVTTMDYFEFCDALREGPPPGRWKDFVPTNFHLGHPKNNAADAGQMESRPPGMPPGETASPKQERQTPPSAPWGILTSTGDWIAGFNNTRAEVYTATAAGAKVFDHRTDAEAWRQRYCGAVESHVAPLA